MVLRVASLLAVVGLAPCVSSCAAFRPGPRLGAVVEREHRVETGNASDADLHVVFYGGEVKVKPDLDDSAGLVRLVTRDNLEDAEPRWTERREDRHLAVRIWLDSPRRVLTVDENVQNTWELELGRSVPLALDLGFATCEADVDLGGVPLRRAHVSLAAGEAELSFSAPNPVELEQLDLEIGAGKFRVSQLGNARCRSVSLEAAAGDFDIDCGGEWPDASFLRVEAGMGSIELRVPRDLAVRVDAGETVFGEVSAPDFRDEGSNQYVTPDLGDTAPRLTIEIEAAFGSVVLVRE